MKKPILITLVLSLLCASGVYGRLDRYGRRLYHVALHVNTPTGLMSKYGGGLEVRWGNVAVLYNYNKYIGAYPGKQMSAEWEFYLRTAKRHQSYIYFKTVIGEAAYDGDKISMFGYPTDIEVGPLSYIGGGTGYGRRWNFNVFFVTFSTGLKYCWLDSGNEQINNIYTLFRYTGPGAYIDAHFQFGIQL